MKDQSTREAKRILGQAEIMRASVAEELETQKIYTEAARLKTDSHEVLTRMRLSRDEPSLYNEESPANDLVAEEVVDAPSISDQSDEATASEETVDELQQAVDAGVNENGKKPTRCGSAPK